MLSTKTIFVPYNSMLAIVDRQLAAKGWTSVYRLQRFINTITKETTEGIILERVEGFDYRAHVTEDVLPFLGILGFVNGKEPGDGNIAFKDVLPKEQDEVVVAYIIQGMYRGDFQESPTRNTHRAPAHGMLPLLCVYLVQKSDLEPKPYPIVVHTEGITKYLELE